MTLLEATMFVAVINTYFPQFMDEDEDISGADLIDEISMLMEQATEIIKEANKE